MLTLKKSVYSLTLLSALCATPALAQFTGSGYDDYGSFATDPVDLDNEVSEMFGRFFQNSLHIGTDILTGSLGSVYSAGFMLELKFIFYFDKSWGGELGVGWANHSGVYNSTNTGTNGISIAEKMSIVPLQIGFRYGFDPENLPRGFAVINPYLSVNAEYIFRSEDVQGIPITNGIVSTNPMLANLTQGAVYKTTAVGLNFGGGLEFDVYRKKLYAGFDLRYHLTYWSDADQIVGKLYRDGNMVSILGSLTYNY